MTFQITPGDVLADKYQIEERLGSGGMGEVIAARHLELGQRVAIKILHKEVAEGPEAVARFVREGQAAARLRSVHAARVLDVGRLSPGIPYLVMEYLDGKDLSRVIDERGALPLQVAVDYVLQACEAVADAHSLGIVHRDLKPANLFLTLDPFGQPLIKVLDFGISKWAPNTVDPSNTPGSMTNTAVVMGSPLYMPPEQMRSARDADERSDIWALGTILWELLTAHHVWEAETMSAICVRVASDPAPNLCEVRPDLPIALDAVVATCLEKDASRRFQRVVDLASALAPFGGSATQAILGRIQHFAGIGSSVAQSALGSIQVRSGTDTGSSIAAQTPPSPRRGGVGQGHRLSTITPDTWLSGSDPHVQSSEHGSIATRVALAAGILTASLGGISWWASRYLERRSPSPPINGIVVAPEGSSVQYVKAAALEIPPVALPASPSAEPEVRKATPPTVSPIEVPASAPSHPVRTGIAPRSDKSAKVSSTLESSPTAQVKASATAEVEPIPPDSSVSSADAGALPKWGGRK